MPTWVELIDEALSGLDGYAESGNIQQFLTKLVLIEKHGADAGHPLGAKTKTNLTNWRKAVVGDRDWRIVFRVDEAEDKALVLVIGDRSDDEVYAEAQARLDELGDDPRGRTLAEAMLVLGQSRKARKKAAKKARKRP